ncbi:ATPase Cu transporting protein 7B [Blomia tropicalis]|nr:ATPase Cu transporting protein 7B [Blomia tropicalis]
MAENLNEIKLKIPGITCGNCVKKIKNHLKDKFADSIEQFPDNNELAIDVDLSEKILTIKLKENFDGIGQSIVDSIELLDPVKYKCTFISNQNSNSVKLSRTGSNHSLSKKSIDVVKRKCYLNVSGMTCSSCVATIENRLNTVNGIYEAVVALMACRAEVHYDPAKINPEQIAELIEDMGFNASVINMGPNDSNQQSEIMLDIVGITGPNCWNHIQMTIKDLPGIVTIQSKEDVGKVVINYYADQIGPRKIVDTINELGFSAFPCNADIIKNASDPMLEEIAKWKSSFLFSLIFGIPTIVAMFYFGHFWPSTTMSDMTNDCCVIPGVNWENLILFIFATPVQFYGGRYFYIQAYKALKNGYANMDVLIMLATTIAYIYSVAIVLYFMVTGAKQSPMTFFDTPPMLLVFISLGRWLEHTARHKTSESLSHLMSMQPTEVTLVEVEKRITSNNEISIIMIKSEREISIDLVEKGDYLRVRPGERIPVDGKVIDGNAMVNESLVTGESLPTNKNPGSSLLAGSIVQNGVLIMVATNIGRNTTLSQIVQMVQEAQATKAPIQQLADKVSAFFVPFVVLISIISLVVWLVIGSQFYDLITALNPHFYRNMPRTEVIIQFAFQIALSVLTISCPCALGLATPTAVMVGTGIGALNGILIKGSEALENAQKVTSVIFDKTGTLTVGKPSVTNLRFLCKLSPSPTSRDLIRKIITLIGMTESNSDHPIAISVQNYVRSVLKMGKDSSFGNCENINSESGLGICCYIKSESVDSLISSFDHEQLNDKQFDISIRNVSFGKFLSNDSYGDDFTLDKDWFETKGFKVLIGNRKLMHNHNIHIDDEINEEMVTFESNGETVFLVAINSRIICLLSVADTIKPEAPLVVYTLRKRFGLNVILLTGDNAMSAYSVAKKVGIRRVFAEVLPTHKVEKVRQMQAAGNVVAMVGDGINDSPALAQANIGIAIANGTDVAIEAADVVLIHNNLLDVCATIDLSRKTVRRIRLNFLFAIVYNMVAIPLAAGIFIYFGLVLQPWMGSAAMVFSSLSVVISSLLLRTYRKPSKSQLETIEYFRMIENAQHDSKRTESMASLDQMSLHCADNLTEGYGVRRPSQIKRPIVMRRSSQMDETDDNSLKIRLLKSSKTKEIKNIDMHFVSKL